ncbi:SHOCT domain-containing protein [Brevibacillus sp. 179-C 1.1 NHS]|uniref:SHOCT domain-containing protein n=1 Tax=Brevibacillus sp. 179-C 1.1 NHS TaxID=3235177 RepID=UPI0039A15D37
MNGMLMNPTSTMIMCCVIMFLGLLTLIATIGFTTYLVIRTLLRKIRVEDFPLMVLKELYARGEINETEFIKRYEKLNRFPHPLNRDE